MNMSSATLGISKVFILDKYFTELQKFWDTEKRLQGEEPYHLSSYLIIATFSKIICSCQTMNLGRPADGSKH